jgi:hypothetical protein
MDARPDPREDRQEADGEAPLADFGLVLCDLRARAFIHRPPSPAKLAEFNPLLEDIFCMGIVD